jgi:hypothetical protein
MFWHWRRLSEERDFAERVLFMIDARASASAPVPE